MVGINSSSGRSARFGLLGTGNNKTASRVRRTVFAAASCVLTVAGCTPTTSRHLTEPTSTSEMMGQLDRVSQHLAEWGTASLSAPLPTRSNETFRFDLEVSDAELYSSKRTQGAALLAISQALKVGLGVSSSIAPVGPTTKPMPDVPQPSTPDAVGALRELANAFEDDLSLPPGYRARLAASDRAELGMHKFLSAPKGLTDGEEVLFVPFTVSCRPGWRTGGGDHIAQVDVRMSYVISDADGSREFEHGYEDAVYPRVISVYPAFVSQELDLQYSRRQLFALALQLAISGKIASAQGAIDFANRLEQDSRTATGLSQVVSYSNAGRHFGYEFRPAFSSLRDPSAKRSGPGYRLEATSFPAFALVSVNRTDFDQLLRGRAARLVRDDAVLGDAAKLQQLTSLGVDTSAASTLDEALDRVARPPTSPAERAQLDQSRDAARKLLDAELASINASIGKGDKATEEKIQVKLALLRRLVKVRSDVTHTWKPRTAAAVRVSEAQIQQLARILTNSEPLGFDPFTPEGQWVRKRREQLRAEMLNLSPLIEFRPFVELPEKTAFQVTDVQPRIGTTGRESAFVVTGTAFPADPKVSMVVGTTRTAATEVIRISPTRLVAIFPAFASPVSGATLEVSSASGQIAFTPPISVRASTASANVLEISVTRGTDPTFKIALPADVTPETLKALGEMLRGASSGVPGHGQAGQADVKIEVKATQPSPP